MALNLLLLASLVLACLPLSWSYRNGARSESCYDMLVMHERSSFSGGGVAPPADCGSSCSYQLSMVGRVAGEDNFTVEESNPTTYQCGEVYYLQLAGSQTATIDGIMVEARENTPSFEEGSTIWGTWVNFPNSYYHTVECNRSSTSSEGPFPNAATQNDPQDATSVDLYWRAPPPPNTTAEYQQLPLEIKFWFVVEQQRLIYYFPVAGPVLARNCTEPTSPTSPTSPTTSISPSAVSTATSTPTTSLPTTASPAPPPTIPTTPLPPTTASSTSPPTTLSEVQIIALAAGIAGGVIVLLLLLLIIVTVVICCLVAKSRKKSDFYDKPDEGTTGSFKMGKKKNKPAMTNPNVYNVRLEPIAEKHDEG